MIIKKRKQQNKEYAQIQGYHLSLIQDAKKSRIKNEQIGTIL